MIDKSKYDIYNFRRINKIIYTSYKFESNGYLPRFHYYYITLLYYYILKWWGYLHHFYYYYIIIFIINFEILT